MAAVILFSQISIDCKRGFTALHCACRRPFDAANEEMISILVKGGADVTIKNKVQYAIAQNATFIIA